MSYHELNPKNAFRLGGFVKDLSLREIARQLNRSQSTVSREIRRNSDVDGNYTAFGTLEKV